MSTLGITSGGTSRRVVVDPLSGENAYRRICVACHDKNADFPAARGAPRLGDWRAWESRKLKGIKALAESVLNPVSGGMVMPIVDLTDDEVRAAIAFMLDQVRRY